MSLTTEREDTAAARRAWLLKDLPPYRPVARKLMSLTSDPEVPLTKIQEILRTDASFTADVLRLANSPLMDTRGTVRSVMHAVIMLGLEHIKSLATTLALRAFLTSTNPSPAMQACWRHNLATASICEKIARHCEVDSDAAYTSGLLHDIGRLVLLQACPGPYQQIFLTTPGPDFDLLKHERKLLEVDHCQAGEWILEQWDFPEEFRQLARHHHDKPAAGTSDLLRIVYVSWQIADMLGFSVLQRPMEADIAEIAIALPGNLGPWLIDQYDGLAEEVAFKINAIECSLL